MGMHIGGYFCMYVYMCRRMGCVGVEVGVGASFLVTN